MSSSTETKIFDSDLAFKAFERKRPLSSSDPLDQILIEEDKNLARDVRRTHAKRILTEETIRLKELEDRLDGEEMETSKQAEGPEVDPKVYQMIISLPEAEREKALEVYTNMVAARGMKGEGAYMPLILSQMNARPKDSAADLVTSVTTIVDLIERNRTPPSNGSNDKAVDALVTLATQPKTGTASETAALITAIADVVRGNQPQASAEDPVETATRMVRNLKDLGLMGGPAPPPSGMSDETRIRLEEIRRDTDFKLAELGLKRDTDLRKLEADEKRTNAIGNVIERAAKVAGRALGEGENEGAGQQAAMAAPQVELPQVACPSCRKTIVIPNPAQARDLECPHCKAILHWDGKA